MIEKYALLKAMREVLTHPIKRFSIHDLARSTRLSVNACKYSLDFMLSKNIVGLEKIGRSYQYKANLDSYLTRQWKVIFSLEELNKAQIVENIIKTKKTILSITLYGSVARGTDDELSDIDIIVIADTDSNGKKLIIGEAIAAGREINPIVYTPMEWRKKAESDKVFYENVVINSVNLYGEKPVVL